MSRFEDYLNDYKRQYDATETSVASLLAFTGEELARAVPRVAAAEPGEMTEAARYLLSVALDHGIFLSGEDLHDQAAATLISVLALLLNRKADPGTFRELYQEALVDIVAPATQAMAEAHSAGDMFAFEHWKAILLQQVAIAAATIRAFGLPMPGGAAADALGMVLAIADNEPSVPSTWNGRPITPFSAIDIISDSAARLNALCLI